MKVHTRRSSCKLHIILSGFNQSWIFSPDFRIKKAPKYQISWNSIQWEPSCSCERRDRRD